MKLIILIGPSGSGKSTWARKFFKNSPYNTIILNRDKMREMLFGYTESTIHEYYTIVGFNKFEKIVSNTIDSIIIDNLYNDVNIIVDNTHLKLKYISSYFKYNVPVEFVWLDSSKEECIYRDSKRIRKVGIDIINKQWEEFKQLKQYYNEKGGFKA